VSFCPSAFYASVCGPLCGGARGDHIPCTTEDALEALARKRGRPPTKPLFAASSRPSYTRGRPHATCRAQEPRTLRGAEVALLVGTCPPSPSQRSCACFQIHRNLVSTPPWKQAGMEMRATREGEEVLG
jgi:hypothetical protein